MMYPSFSWFFNEQEVYVWMIDTLRGTGTSPSWNLWPLKWIIVHLLSHWSRTTFQVGKRKDPRCKLYFLFYSIQQTYDWMLMILGTSSRHYFGFVWNLVWAVKASANHNNGTLNIRLHWSYAKLCWKQSNWFNFHIFIYLISFCRNSHKNSRDTYWNWQL